jgi:hypothetical protein
MVPRDDSATESSQYLGNQLLKKIYIAVLDDVHADAGVTGGHEGEHNTDVGHCGIMDYELGSMQHCRYQPASVRTRGV